MSHKINLAIQVLPLGIPKDDAYKIVDHAIKCIDESGMNYEVSAFETVVEGDYDEVIELVSTIQDRCRQAGAKELIINMKLQRSFIKDVLITDKTRNYR